MPRPPKDPAIRQRRNKTATAAVLVAERPRRIPSLGRHPNGKAWSPRTREWWAASWRSVVASKYLTIDAHRFAQIAVLVDDFWKAEDARTRRELDQEIRLAIAAFGQTPLDRWRLQWSVHEKPVEAPPAPAPAPMPRPPSSSTPGDDPRKLLAMVKRA